MRIGIYGGTFNPIHLGHLITSSEVKDRFSLDRILIIPSAIPPHKGMEHVADAKDRLEMIQLAVANDSEYHVCDIELKRLGPSYTIDTVQYLISSEKKDEFHLIVGLDAILEIHTWKSYMSFFKSLPIIVMARPGTKNPWETLGVYLETNISEEYCISTDKNAFKHRTNQTIYLHNGSMMDVSSSQIRELIRQGQTVRHLVPQRVADYIQEKGLYK